MSRQRASSEASKTPHSVSLKVLRLSKPALSSQHPLPKQGTNPAFPIDPQAALSYTSPLQDAQFILSPLLTLPPAFGTVYVGETFSCTVCANNELPVGDHGLSLSGVRMTAEMQTPSEGTVPLDLTSTSAATEDASSLLPGETMQRIVHFDLRDEGNHVLAVTVTYTETQMSSEGQGATSGRVRTFRKLYQFAAQQLLSVRTKSRVLPTRDGYTLEAQVENLGDQAVVLEGVNMKAKSDFTCKSLNAWDMPEPEGGLASKPVLWPGNVLQLAFLLRETSFREAEPSQTSDGRVALGQMTIQWRGAMGEPGSLNTGWLCGRGR